MDPNPALTEINPDSKVALEQLVKRSNIFVGVISGRPISNLLKKVVIDNITFSGNHGMEILFTNKTEYHYPISEELYRNCTKIYNILKSEVVNLQKKIFNTLTNTIFDFTIFGLFFF